MFSSSSVMLKTFAAAERCAGMGISGSVSKSPVRYQINRSYWVMIGQAYCAGVEESHAMKMIVDT